MKELFGVKNWNDFVNLSTVLGRTEFQIPDVNWLFKHNWITKEERDQMFGGFFLREFTITPLRFMDFHKVWREEIVTEADRSPMIATEYRKKSALDRKQADFAWFSYMIDNRYPVKDGWPSPYIDQNCEISLSQQLRHRLTSTYNGDMVVPNIFAT